VYDDVYDDDVIMCVTDTNRLQEQLLGEGLGLVL
jgi:hypothetical protein